MTEGCRTLKQRTESGTLKIPSISTAERPANLLEILSCRPENLNRRVTTSHVRLSV
jgi:hypothetical protein